MILYFLAALYDYSLYYCNCIYLFALRARENVIHFSDEKAKISLTIQTMFLIEEYNILYNINL